MVCTQYVPPQEGCGGIRCDFRVAASVRTATQTSQVSEGRAQLGQFGMSRGGAGGDGPFWESSVDRSRGGDSHPQRKHSAGADAGS